ncbi:glycosyl hydrolase family 18 protein [Clostridium sp. YIM B02551]|uniref:glycosyl hydrolase family 18 protein n=1 Tax=Clostridium sp. YIM B02551 TaxID=2910679 RepID=UPI001EEB6351|nr:glycosyl hydrolase family 18 protein [Clostridium sp. YIM B02551]
MKKKIASSFIASIFTLLLALGVNPNVKASAATNYKVIGYIYGSPSSSMDVSKLTHINYAFASINSDHTIKVDNTSDLRTLTSLKSKNPNLKVILSVGGWGMDGFSQAASTAAGRSAFAQSCLNYVNQYGLDGIDIDWEYPVDGGGGIIARSPSDKQNFTLLLQAIRNSIGTGKILSIAAGASYDYVNSWIEIGNVKNIVDYINLMTYDFTNGNTLNSNTYNSSLATSGYSCEAVVNNYLNAGVPAAKLNLGMPFYGRTTSGGWPTYTELVNNYINKNGYVRQWDSAAQAPYLTQNGKFAVTYEDPQSIAVKDSFIKSKGLGGAMFWEYSQDNGQLIAQIWNDLGSSNPNPTPSKIVAIKASVNSKYVCADNYGNNPLIANRDSYDAWEEFEQVDLGNGTVAFKSLANNQYVSAQNGGGSTLIANRASVGGAWEAFQLITQPDGKIAIKSMANNQYVCAENYGNDPLMVNRTTVSGWEEFDIITVK